jgi:hypothetical protein
MPSRPTVTITKASPFYHDHHLPDVQILMTGEPPNFTFPDLHDAATWYDAQAEALFNVLRTSLPGGTLDRLTAKLLMHKATLFRVPL